MSWDVFFMALPPGTRSMEELPGDYVPPALCSRARLLETIRAVAPTADLSDPSWGRLQGDGFSIELNLGDDDPVGSVMLHVRGGDGALGVIRELAEALGQRALDTTTGELIDFSSPEAGAGFRAWRAFRDGVVR